MPSTYGDMPSRASTFPLYHSARHKPRRWPLVLRMTKGSVHLSVMLPLAFHCGFTALVVYYDLYVKSVGVPGSIVPSLSIVVGLMLVFRNSSSYDRFWTGRNNLSQMCAGVRNLTRYFLACSRNSKDERTEAERVDTEATVRVLVTILYAVKHNLRAEFGDTSVTNPGTPLWSSTVSTPFLPTPGVASHRRQSLLDAEAVAESLNSTTVRPEYNEALPQTLSYLEDHGLSMPLQLAVNVEAYIRRGVLRGWWAPPQASYLDTQLGNIVSNYTAMETIRFTPLPVAHLIHVKQVLALYMMVLPFAMVDEWAWWTIPLVGVVTFTLYGIESIGKQLEDPFGYDRNDIKMDAIVEDAKMECEALLEEWRRKDSVLFH
ncbi:uncharacterized protein PV09_05049 [Verruconis gallopava]|uniref:Uncharacterized protein n=1 Tax=Verruconis gallopava TaxID=253628 RepID=A0A0D1YSX3_9PEZI|nr:uncharacterized protein PV09_05049 [Verruconis gallopava]KIW03742.1 hypothetical protein PV09_05049 [Verruconis gallopava]